MSKMRSMSQHDPWGSLYKVPERPNGMNKDRRDPVIGKAPAPKTREIILQEAKPLLEDALTVEGKHHKQWYLWRLAEVLGLDLDIDADRGVAP